MSSNSSNINDRLIQEKRTSSYIKNFEVADVDNDAAGYDHCDAANDDNDNTDNFDVPDINANQSFSSACLNSDNCVKNFAESDHSSESSNQGLHSNSGVTILTGKSSFQFSSGRLYENSDVSVQISVISLLSLFSKQGCFDELLFDLIRRERIIHPDSNFPATNALKSLIPKVVKISIRTDKYFGNGQLICLNFLPQLQALLEKNLGQLLCYSGTRKSQNDFVVPTHVEYNTINIFLILNTALAVFRKSASESA